ncbi:hypothetical protein PISMIDRAFT_615830 [Pisolithus microcarpus 441]|uniref:Uncharacterized protein n=1 Tax=Pisolithus microcarpus 441 TaxID=765257 RepID=A0A0C9XQS6_9AGAM|nr:hypothetical protein PISMIDRAFT_347297 [Pisolithus microcarpus 441]KIK19963.1 hypothetical protein PISMIDRAFT_615830 [Pisolithus microcarpus 441]
MHTLTGDGSIFRRRLFRCKQTSLQIPKTVRLWPVYDTRLISRTPLTFRMNADNATAGQILLIWQCMWRPDSVIEGQSRMPQVRNPTKRRTQLTLTRMHRVRPCTFD